MTIWVLGETIYAVGVPRFPMGDVSDVKASAEDGVGEEAVRGSHLPEDRDAPGCRQISYVAKWVWTRRDASG